MNVLAASMLAVAALAAPVLAATKSSVYTVAKLEADASAKDAVAAKAKALAEAEQKVLRTVLKRVVPFGSYERLPKVKSSLIQDMLVGFSVRSEANSGTRYIATLDYEFKPEAVRKLLAGYNIPFGDEQAPAVKLLPLMLAEGKVAPPARDAWRKAWLGLDLSHSLTPVQLVQVGGVDKATADAISAGDRGAFQTLRAQYKADAFIVAIADHNDAEKRLVTRLVGIDAAGTIDLERSDRIVARGIDPTAARAALIALRVIESRWKVIEAPGGVDTGTAAQSAISMRVEFGSLKQWQEMKDRLTQMPGVQALAIDALSARSAQVTFQFAGGADRLSQQLASHNFNLQGREGAWVLRAN